jgi:hypothetical protein
MSFLGYEVQTELHIGHFKLYSKHFKIDDLLNK